MILNYNIIRTVLGLDGIRYTVCKIAFRTKISIFFLGELNAGRYFGLFKVALSNTTVLFDSQAIRVCLEGYRCTIARQITNDIKLVVVKSFGAIFLFVGQKSAWPYCWFIDEIEFVYFHFVLCIVDDVLCEWDRDRDMIQVGFLGLPLLTSSICKYRIYMKSI